MVVIFGFWLIEGKMNGYKSKKETPGLSSLTWRLVLFKYPKTNQKSNEHREVPTVICSKARTEFFGTAVFIWMYHGKMEATRSLLSFLCAPIQASWIALRVWRGSHTLYDCNCIWSSWLGFFLLKNKRECSLCLASPCFSW